MAKVPRILQRSQNAPIPNVRDNTRYTPADFGGDLANVIGKIGQGAAQIANMQKKEKRKADNARLNELQRGITDLSKTSLRNFKQDTDGSDPEAGNQFITEFNKLTDEQLKDIQDPELLKRADEMRLDSQMVFKHSVIGLQDKKTENYDTSVAMSGVKSSQDYIYENVDIPAAVANGFWNIRANIERLYEGKRSKKEIDLIVDSKIAETYVTMGNMYLESENIPAVEKMMEGDRFKETVPKKIRDEMDARVTDRKLVIDAEDQSETQFADMVQADDFSQGRFQKATQLGLDLYVDNPNALRTYNRQLNGKIKEFQRVEKERLDNDAINTGNAIVGAGTLSKALSLADRGDPKNRERMIQLAESEYNNVNKDKILIPDGKRNFVIASARNRIFNGEIESDKIDIEYPLLPPSDRKDLQKFAKSVATDDIDSKLWSLVKRSLTTKMQEKPENDQILMAFENVKAMNPDKLPTGKDVSDSIDILRLNGELIPDVKDPERGGAMTFAEARALGQGEFWIPDATDELTGLVKDKSGQFLTVESNVDSELPSFVVDRVKRGALMRSELGLPRLGVDIETASEQRVAGELALAQAAQRKTQSRNVARSQLNKMMSDYSVTVDGEVREGLDAMRSSLAESASWGEIPDWMETILRVSGDYNALQRKISSDKDNAEVYIMQIGDSLLYSADDRK